MKISMTVTCRKGLMVFAFAKAIFLTTSCKTETYTAKKLTASQTQIDSTINAVDEIENYIAPYKKSLDLQMDTPLSYNPAAMYKNDTPLNTRIGNMMAAIARMQGEPVYTSRTGNDVDVVLLNHGGIRAGIPQGDVTLRTAYEVMPFENEIVVAELAPAEMKELVNYLAAKKLAHPFDGLQIELQDDAIKSVTLNGSPLTYDRNYFVMTNDYLLSGGDNMDFFTRAISSTRIDYKVRNAMIDYFKKTDTLGFDVDNRFTKKD
ncbi:5'-nucleotidase C-terminal domain-containing protein [Nonlabens marinus]|uniref:5'-nucleotidase n=1 Tax=Nonlabens marinus S1-08 TaxID=1454201 RepID=W8VXG3_9FLAO|nr:5'-nucleotidase [Nonlabens marinus]BAO55877.1 5'-nucleotidase [Nonlabens marinus S1-08]